MRPIRSRLLALAAASLILGLGACPRKQEPAPPAPLPLDARLQPGEVRAGQISRAEELIGGVTEKGRVGDYKLYNSRVAVVVSAPGRGSAYNPFGGVIVDADIVRPPMTKGRSNYGEVLVAADLSIARPLRVEVVSDGRDGKEARIRVHGEDTVLPLFDVLTRQILQTRDEEVEFDVDYVLEPDASNVRIEYTVRNLGKEIVEYGGFLSAFLFSDGAQPFAPGFGYRVPSNGETVDYFAAVADSVSYLYGRTKVPLEVFITQSGVTAAGHGDRFLLRERDEHTVVHHLVIGDGDLARTQGMWRDIVGTPQPPVVSGLVAYGDDAPVAGARVHAIRKDGVQADADYMSTARTDEAGRYEFRLPPGQYDLRATLDQHLPGETRPVLVRDEDRQVDLDLERAAAVRYRITDDAGTLLPAKITVRAASGSVTRLPTRYGLPGEPGGVVFTEYGIRGEGTFKLPAGTYDVWVSRGAEYSMVRDRVVATATGTAMLDAVINRVVDTTGWISTDTHIHSQLSPDSPDLYPFKVSAMVVEGLEMPVCTEHENIGDFNPAIEALGLTRWMKGVVGSEVTTFVYGHFNAWPLHRDPELPGNGRIDWFYKKPGEMFALVRANPGEPFVQVNHPRSAAIGGYFSAMGYDRTTGTAASDDFSMDFDGIEVANGCNAGSIEQREMLDWFSFLEQGHRKYALGSTDDHKARGGGLGFPLTYVRMPTDDPREAEIEDFRRAMLGGRMSVTCGPFFEMKIDDAEVGDLYRVTDGAISARVKVAAPEWMDVDQVELVVNGEVAATRAVDETTASIRFDDVVTASVAAGRDGWVILRVRGDERHSTWARSRPSWGFTNPIFLDVDGDGRWMK